MKMNLKELAKKLHGDINGPWLNIQGLGHSKSDRSLGIRFHPSAPDGFWINSLAGDDPAVCREHVLERLANVASADAIECVMQEAPANDAGQQTMISHPNALCPTTAPRE
jgi:hypothetical protein